MSQCMNAVAMAICDSEAPRMSMVMCLREAAVSTILQSQRRGARSREKTFTQICLYD
jgi:hypothetical protein